MTLSVIFARNEANIIGVNSALPWDIKEDLSFFKEQTIGGVVIMGRKTFESMGRKALKGRANIVLQSRVVLGKFTEVEPDGTETTLHFAPDILKAMAIAMDFYPEKKNVFVIGGATPIEAALLVADKLIMTTVLKDVNRYEYNDVSILKANGLIDYLLPKMTVNGETYVQHSMEEKRVIDRATGLEVKMIITTHRRAKRFASTQHA